MQSVTLDSNIYISALVFGGEPMRLLQMAEDGLIRLDVSEAILEEFGGVLRKKFEWPAEEVEAYQQQIRSFANLVKPVEALAVVRADSDDNAIVECAAAARSDYLVTGDKHLLQIGSFRGTKIIRSAELSTTGRDY